jgi:hypothetical protein
VERRSSSCWGGGWCPRSSTCPQAPLGPPSMGGGPSGRRHRAEVRPVERQVVESGRWFDRWTDRSLQAAGGATGPPLGRPNRAIGRPVHRWVVRIGRLADRTTVGLSESRGGATGPPLGCCKRPLGGPAHRLVVRIGGWSAPWTVGSTERRSGRPVLLFGRPNGDPERRSDDSIKETANLACRMLSEPSLLTPRESSSSGNPERPAVIPQVGMEPTIGFEPMTCRLRGGCSTTELRRLGHAILGDSGEVCNGELVKETSAGYPNH